MQFDIHVDNRISLVGYNVVKPKVLGTSNLDITNVCLVPPIGHSVMLWSVLGSVSFTKLSGCRSFLSITGAAEES